MLALAKILLLFMCFISPAQCKRVRERKGVEGEIATHNHVFQREDKARAKLKVTKIGERFWNIRSPFWFFDKIPIGTHMSIVQLEDGNFISIDAVELDSAVKYFIDEMTNNGTKLVACLFTHPFHTTAIPNFHDKYPATSFRKYFGAPRHLERFPNIAWAGDIRKHFTDWPKDLEMLIPAGAVFVDPKPPKDNHLANVIVFHKRSKTVFVDDTIMNLKVSAMLEGGGGRLLVRLLKFAGKIKKGFMFHPSLFKYYNTDDRHLFKASMESLLGWDFENLCSAHNSCTIGTAKIEFERLMNCTNFAKGDNKAEKLPPLASDRHPDCG